MNFQLLIKTRAVIVIDDNYVSIKRAAIFISIQKFGYLYLSILGQARIVDFFLEAYIMEVKTKLPNSMTVCTRHFKVL